MFGMTRGFDTVRIHSAQAREILRIARDRVLAWTRRNAKTRQIVEWLNRLATIVHASPKADNGARAALKDVSTLLRSGYPSHFVTLNLMEAHHPYYARGRLSDWRYRFEHAAPLSDWSGLTFAVLTGRIPVTTSIRRVVSDLYWENVRYLDAQVGRLYEALNHGFLDSSYLILLSDHGQFLGERGLMDHVTGLYEEVIRVPLAIRPPGGVSAEAQEFPVDISWLFPLLVSIARGRDRHPVPNWIAWAQKRGPIISQAHGGIVPHAHAPKAGDSEFTQDLLAFKKEHDHPGIAVVGGSWKLICHLGRKEDEVYDLSASDPERTNHIWEQPEIARQLHDSIATSLSLTDDTVRGPVRQVHNMG